MHINQVTLTKHSFWYCRESSKQEIVAVLQEPGMPALQPQWELQASRNDVPSVTCHGCLSRQRSGSPKCWKEHPQLSFLSSPRSREGCSFVNITAEKFPKGHFLSLKVCIFSKEIPYNTNPIVYSGPRGFHRHIHLRSTLKQN